MERVVILGPGGAGKSELAARIARRTGLPDGCSEGLDLDLLRWIWRSPQTDRPHVLALLAALEQPVDIQHLRSPSDVRRFLATM